MGRQREDGKRTGAAADRRRAAGYLVQLKWLAGFPDDGGWRQLEDDRVIALEGGAVAKARRIARTAMREHPKALPKLVGDVDRWWSIVDAKLSWCSAAIAGTAGALDVLPLVPARTAQAVRELVRTRVGDAARAAAIAWASEPDVLEDLVDWLAAHRDALRVVEEPVGDLAPWRVMLALARLVVIGAGGKARVARERGGDALIALCGVDAPDPMSALDVTRNVESRLRRQKAKDAPVLERSRPRVMPWIVDASTRDEDALQRMLAVAAVAQIAEGLAPWEAWERTHAGLMVRAEELAGHEFEASDKVVHDVRVIQKLEKVRAQAPVPLSISEALYDLQRNGDQGLARCHGSIVRLLTAMPAALGPAARARMLLHVTQVAATADDDDHVEWVWDALADALDDSAPLELLSPWHGTLTTDGRLYVEQDLIEHAKRRSDVQRLMRVLVDLAWRGKLGSEDPERAAAWLAAGVDSGVARVRGSGVTGVPGEELVAELVVALRAVDGYLLVEVGRGALAIAEPTVADLTAITKLLLELTESCRHDRVKHLSVLLEHAAKTGGAWLVREALEAKQGELLLTIADTMRLQPKSKWPPLTREVDAPWIDRYPAALEPALRRLASVDPEAERAAAKRLATDLPAPAALDQEIRALRDRLDKPGVAKRLASLEARRAAPKLPSAARLATLATKLERAAREIGLSRFTSEITRGASERVMKAFGMAELPPWATAPKTIALLFALLELGTQDRELAGRLIRARSGPPPWDLRDEPANRDFLAQMRRANVDPGPWLDDTARAITPKDGEPFTLGMTSDPIEVFAMGAHFETCLSPVGGNFFSVVANAADINKRVIYAKRGDRVLGRCLLALTEAFSILSFNVYSHDAIALDDHVRDFVLDLAKRMSTSVVPRGSVSRLLSRDWYDDGPLDLVGRFRGLDDLDFDAIDPSTLVGVLCAVLDRPLDNVTLPIVLSHHRISGRPELVIPLAPFVLASNVPLIRVTGAELALRAGDPALADRMLGEHQASVQPDEWHYGQLLAQLRPSYALARLRETRRRDVRSWNEEQDERIALAGVALEALHRPKQAAAMYRIAIARESWLAFFLRTRLEALGENVDDLRDD